MGYMSTVVILHDAMSEIDKDPVGWWKITKESILTFNRYVGSVSYGFGNHGNGFQIAHVDHADMTHVLAVGQNSATDLGTAYAKEHYDEKGQVELLKTIAALYGYNLHKKPEKRTFSYKKYKEEVLQELQADL